MSGYTKGPWTAGTATEWGVRNPDGIYAGDERVAQVYGVPMNALLHELNADKLANGIANARLIAAAPELLEALLQANAQMQMAGDCIEAGRYDEALLHVRALCRQRREVVDKATGGSHA